MVWSLPPAAWAAWASAAAWVAVASTIATHAETAGTTIAAAAAITTAHTHAAAATTVRWTLATAVGTNILHGRCTATTTTAWTASTAATTTKAGTFTSDALQETWHFLIGLFEQVDEVTNNATIATVEEGGGDTGVAGTASTSDAVDIVVDVRRKVVVDHVLDVRDIQSFIGSQYDSLESSTEEKKTYHEQQRL